MHLLARDPHTVRNDVVTSSASVLEENGKKTKNCQKSREKILMAGVTNHTRQVLRQFTGDDGMTRVHCCRRNVDMSPSTRSMKNLREFLAQRWKPLAAQERK